jgi:hypothetical protein
MNPDDPHNPHDSFSSNITTRNGPLVSDHDLFGVAQPDQIYPESLLTPPRYWSLWNGRAEGGVFGITSTLESKKEFHFNITNKDSHYKITPEPGGSSDEARDMLLRVSSYNGPLNDSYPTLVLNGPGIDFGHQLRIRIVKIADDIDHDLYDIYFNPSFKPSFTIRRGGVAKSVRRHSCKLYSRRRVYKKRLSMNRRCRSRRRGRSRRVRRSRKN